MKKILDVIPPQKAYFEVSKKSSKKKPFLGFVLKLILVFCLIFGAITVLSFYSRLTLNLKLVKESIDIQEEVEVAVSQETPDFQKKIIPGKIFEIEKEKLETFQATGNDFEEGKAQGVIRVYNTQNPPTSITLRDQTRFLSSEGGKIFRASEKISLPPAQIQGGKVIPSSKEVAVVAQESGEEYNIGPSKFSVPGLAGIDLYYTVWAESTARMEGGFKKEIKKITIEDLDNAQQSLREKLKEIAKKALEDKMPEGYVLKDKAVFEEDFESSCSQEAEARVPEFNCQGKIKAVGLAVKAVDLKNVASYFLLAQIPFGKTLVPQSLNFDFSPKGTVTEGEKMSLNLRIEGKLYDRFNQDTFLSQIKGERRELIEKTIFENYPQVESVEFKFWPFWIKKAPKAAERIEIGLTF